MGKRLFLNICESCNGYTTDEEETECPVCGNFLVFKAVDEKKAKYKNLDNASFGDSFDFTDNSTDDLPVADTTFKTESKATEDKNIFDDDEIIIPETKPQSKPHGKAGFCDSYATYSGVVYNYKNTDTDKSKYSRLLIMKLFDAIVYGQRTEDVLHYFKLHTVTGKDSDGMEISKKINVNVHGTIVGGAHIDEHSRVTVRGKFKNGVLMATDIIDDDCGSHIYFKRSYKAIITVIVLAVLFITSLIYSITSSKSFSGVFDNIGLFFGTLVAVYAVLVILYMVISFTKFGLIMRMVSHKKSTVPWVALFIVAFAITVLILFGSSGSSGTSSGAVASNGSLSQMISELFICAIMIYGIVLMFKSLKR